MFHPVWSHHMLDLEAPQCDLLSLPIIWFVEIINQLQGRRNKSNRSPSVNFVYFTGLGESTQDAPDRAFNLV